MCGIFGYIGRGNASQIVFDGLYDLQYRGYDSWGIAAVKNNHFHVHKQVGKIVKSKIKLPDTNIAIGHTRWATHGGVTKLNCHPHTDCHKQYMVVHNGIIENYDLLKSKLMKQGHKFSSSTDTEVIAHQIEEFHKIYPLDDSIKKTFSLITGLSTIVILTKEGDIYAYKYGSPLCIAKYASGEIYLSSDLPSLSNICNNIAVIEDDTFIQIIGGKIKTKLSFKKYNLNYSESVLGSYPHYTLKEIDKQQSIWEGITKAFKSQKTDYLSIIKRANSVYLVGCGSAYYAMHLTSYLFAKYAGVHTTALSSNEFGDYAPLLNAKSVVIVASQSGETMDSIVALRAAKRVGATTITYTNVMGSTLAREADFCLDLSVGMEKSVISTKAFTAMLAISHLILGQDKIFANLSDQVKKVLSQKKNIKELAQKLVVLKDLYIIGKSLAYPLALESALKFKETSYLHAEGFASGELKHGVMALIEEGTYVIAILLEDEYKADVLSSIMELKARGAKVIGLSKSHESIFDHWIEIPGSLDQAVYLSIIAIQLLSYYLSIAKGLNPDMPRNLAKSVTVK